jgi:hypothetical protein
MPEGGPIDGSGAPCTPVSQEVIGAKITLPVVWPTTLANGGEATPQNIYIWLLSNYTISGNKVSGTVTTCQNQTPPIPLSALGSMAEGVSDGGIATVDVQFNPMVWQKIAMNPMKAATQTTGTIGGWNIGSSLATDPSTSFYGLNPQSTWANPSTAWPCSESSIMMSDITDDDMDGHPGITTTPSNMMGYSFPATASAPGSAQADELYVVHRTELSLYGTSSSCTDGSGTATVQLLNNHVVGCHLAGQPASGGACSAGLGMQYDFIDQNTTVYLGKEYVMGGAVMIPQNPCLPQLPPKISGTYVSKVLSSDGGTATCADVLTALP